MLDKLMERYPALAECRAEIEAAYALLVQTAENGGKILLCGNGGSCADCDHIVGELMKDFLSARRVSDAFCDRLTEAYGEDGAYYAAHLQGAIPAISLCSQTGLLTAFANDEAADLIYAQGVYGYGVSGDLLLALSTSGNSKNVVHAVKVAKAMGLRTIAMTGSAPCILDMCDVCIKVPARETYQVQEYHLPVYHCLCAMLEKTVFGEEEK